MLDDLGELNRLKLADYHDPGNAGAHRSIRDGLPHAGQRAGAGGHVEGAGAAFSRRYGPESRKPGTYAANCLLARRLAERGVRFIQLYHRGWDQHNNLPRDIKSQCYDTDQPTAALLTELKERGLFDDTLVVWGGEFGRTVYSQGVAHERQLRPRSPPALLQPLGRRRRRSSAATSSARPTTSATTSSRIPSTSTTSTPRSSINSASTTRRFTYRHQGRDYRLTDVSGKVVKEMLA